MTKTNHPEGASLSEFVILPNVEQDPLTGKAQFSHLGYMLNHYPCPTCVSTMTIEKYKSPSWTHVCEECGNFLKFGYVGSYTALICTYGKDLKDISNFARLHFFFKGKYGTIDGKSPIP